jgi:LDH2 family malate/lactate/ureidoglycolate dehydrogenase
MPRRIVSPARLHKFCVSLLKKVGLNEQHATIVADSLLFADLRGTDSHGVVRLKSYLERAQMGVMNVNPDMRIEHEYAAVALLNAQNGFGQIAGTKAMELAIRKAKIGGVALVGVKNSNHFGVAAFFATKAIQENMIGLAMTNASPAIAPYDSKVPLLGTNPFAVAIPALHQRPIVLDMATSLVARGKIRLAALAGREIPKDWALDSNGDPTSDPVAALKGSMAAIGGPKGSGMSLVIDLLCGVLTGSSFTGEVRNITDTSGPAKTGHLFVAMDIKMLGSALKFKRNMDNIILHIKSLPPVGGRTIYLPGEIEFDLENVRSVEGIPLEADVVASLRELATHYGVSIEALCIAR